MTARHQLFKKVERVLASGDRLRTTAADSKRLARVPSRGTGPELIVRKAARDVGLRYTLDNRDLPGNPDLANRRRGIAIFVHGCFWHRHAKCARATTPKRNSAFWQAKFDRNVARDADARRALRRLGMRVITLWECQLSRPARVANLVKRKLATTNAALR